MLPSELKGVFYRYTGLIIEDELQHAIDNFSGPILNCHTRFNPDILKSYS